MTGAQKICKLHNVVTTCVGRESLAKDISADKRRPYTNKQDNGKIPKTSDSPHHPHHPEDWKGRVVLQKLWYSQ